MSAEIIPEAMFSQYECNKACPYLNRGCGRCERYHMPLRNSDSGMNGWARARYPFERCDDCVEKEG